MYMMATKAMHKLGNISRKKPDICRISGETEDAYIGSWVTGFGFISVRFPKETTRPLTPAEVERYGSMRFQIGNHPPHRLHLNTGDSSNG